MTNTQVPYNVLLRVAKLELKLEEAKKFNPNHDSLGRFSSGRGGGSSRAGKKPFPTSSSVTAGESKKLTEKAKDSSVKAKEASDKAAKEKTSRAHEAAGKAHELAYAAHSTAQGAFKPGTKEWNRHEDKAEMHGNKLEVHYTRASAIAQVELGNKKSIRPSYKD